MDPEIDFFFFLAAVICLALAALGSAWRYGSRTRRGLEPALALMPLGIALAVVPFLADAAAAAF
jgi:hypothetical protein